MRRIASVVPALLLLLLACGSRPPPAEVGGGEPGAPPTPAATMTEEECVDSGGFARWDIGDGSVRCEPGEQPLGQIPVGIEGGVCCRTIDQPD